MNLADIVWIWGENVSLPSGPAPPPTVSVSAWPFLFGQQWTRWTPFVDAVPTTARYAKIAFVNLFHTADSRHIEQLKQVNPACYVVAMPDPTLDLVLNRPDWLNMYQQMALADAIGGRTHADCRVYGTLLNKPTYWIPSPIGPTEFFAPYRDLPKGDYLLTLDHQFAPANTVCNVAATAAIQRQTGLRVLYAAERDWTPDYARLAGLDCEFLGHVEWREFIDLTARARICVDLYTSHSYGRQQVLCAMVGTPIVGSLWCEDAPGWSVNPFKLEDALDAATSILGYSSYYYQNQSRNMADVERRFGFEASKERINKLVYEIEQVKA